MEVDGRTSCCNENTPKEASTSFDQQKKSAGSCTGSPEFVNYGKPALLIILMYVDMIVYLQIFLCYIKNRCLNTVCCVAAIAWEESRRKWMGDVSERSHKMQLMEPIIRYVKQPPRLIYQTDILSCASSQLSRLIL